MAMKQTWKMAVVFAVFALFCAGCTSDQFGTAAAGILSGIGTGLSGL